ncbi:MAG: response regulator [Bryobacteraceae bacterium]
MTRVLLVDDHALFREGLARLLAAEAGIEVSAQCSTVEETLAQLSSSPPDLILLDYELGDRRGNEVMHYIKNHQLHTKVLIVTVGLTRAELRQMLNHGVAGVFLKNNPPDMLLESMRAVLAGDTWIDPKYAESPIERTPGEIFRRVRFTDRDRQVLRGVFEGLANKEIAERLKVSESAIKASLQQLFSKTGVRTRGQLVRIALEQFRRELL